MAKNIFISFDFHNDREIKILIAGQVKLPTSPFWGADWSMKESAPERNWEEEAEKRIKRCDIVLVMVGKQTYKASGVLKEVELARKHNKQIVQIIGHPDIVNPTPVVNAGRLYRWRWETLRTLLS